MEAAEQLIQSYSAKKEDRRVSLGRYKGNAMTSSMSISVTFMNHNHVECPPSLKKSSDRRVSFEAEVDDDPFDRILGGLDDDKSISQMKPTRWSISSVGLGDVDENVNDNSSKQKRRTKHQTPSKKVPNDEMNSPDLKRVNQQKSPVPINDALKARRGRGKR